MANTVKKIKMNEYKQKLSEKDFHNWVKAALAISICKKGIENCVHSTVLQCKDNIHSAVQSNETCSQCSIENITRCKTKNMCYFNKGTCAFHDTEEKKYRPCPKGICDKVKQEILRRHNYNWPSWKNTRVEKWCQNAWEVAKCYMPPDGYSNVTCSADTDLNGLLSVIENLKDFKVLFDLEASKRARAVSNRVRHSSNLSLSDTEMTEDLKVLTQFLKSSKDSHAAEAAKDIHKLLIDELMISTDDVTNVLQDVIQENVHGVNIQNVKFLQETKDALTSVQISTAENLSLILNALTCLKDATHDIMDDIRREKNELKKMTTMRSDNYEENKLKLKNDLLTYNKKHHSTIAISPLSEKKDCPFLGLYVNPPINAVEQPMRDCRRSDIKTPISSFKDIFKPGYNEIYLTSKAGLGKTAFCKRVSVNWCQAHETESDKSEYFERADLEAMLKYDFLFIVHLRNTLPSHCDIDEMIGYQVIRCLSRSNLYDAKFVQEILTQESCLIILDGLDEWLHPEDKEYCRTTNVIPHRKARQHCTILTTSRIWKFGLLDLSINQIHLHIQITELSDEAVAKLIKNGISKLVKGGKGKVKDAVEDFMGKITQKNIHRFKTIPLILMFLICLWHDGKPFGKSNVEVFSNILGFLLVRADNRSKKSYMDEKFIFPQTKKRKCDLAKPLVKNEYFMQYKTLLKKLSHLAFDTCFNIEKREHSIVFDAQTARKYMSDQDLKFLKDAEILYQSEFQGELLMHKDQALKLSFAHETFQNFLAAFYLSTLVDTSNEMKVVAKVCKSEADICSVADFYICLSGLCPDRAKVESQLFSKVISKSNITQGYRKDMGSWNYFIEYNEKVKTLQTLHIDCIWECEDNGQKPFDIYMEDFIIDSDFKQEKYSKPLLNLMARNHNNVKSLKIRDVTTEKRFQEILEIQIPKADSISHLMKLDIKCEFEMKDLECILKRSEKTLKCLVIKGGKWVGNKWWNENIMLSNTSQHIIWSMKQLEELYLRNIEMAHGQLEQLIMSVSQRTKMKHIGLGFIKCEKHGDSCKGFKLGLGLHSQLKMIELGCIPLCEVEVDTSSLEVCYVGNFPISGVLQTILKSLRSAGRLHVFACGFLKSKEDVNDMLETIPHLGNLQHIWLFRMDLDDSAFKKCPYMKNAENVYLMYVNIRGYLLKDFVSSLTDVPKTIRVGLYDCEVQTQAEFESVKQSIRASRKFKVLQDESSEFLFRTFRQAVKSYMHV